MAQKQGFVFDPRTAVEIEVLADRPVTRVEVPLRRGGVITGRILDPRGEPLAEISVMLMRKVATSSGGSPGMPTIPTQTNDLGEFRLAGIPDGEYTLLATVRSASMLTPRAPAVRPTALAPTYYAGVTDHTQSGNIVVRAGDTISGLEWRMISAPAFTVSGVVVAQDGRVVPDAMVQLFYDTTVPGPPPTLGVRTNADGTFAVAGVVSGKYTISASPLIRAGTTMTTSMNFTISRQPLVVDNADVSGLKVLAQPPPQR
jgi:hypothetical protein